MFTTLTSRVIGNSAEKAAKQFLTQQGLTYIDCNYHSRFGEIDLIFKEKDILVFIEVRCRNNTHYGNSFETIDYRKQSKIIKTARHYLHQKNLTESVCCRFDVIGIEPQASTPKTSEIKWIKNAFS